MGFVAHRQVALVTATVLPLQAGAEPAELVVHGTTATMRFGDEP